jgi:hypothetical protein
MKKFDEIAESIFRTMLEAELPPPVPPTAAPAPAPAAGLPQDGGPVQATPGNDTAADRSPAEIKNWETELLDIAKDAIMNVRNNPNSVSEHDVKVLTMPVTVDNKDKPGGIMDVLNKLAGKA